jgi:hypothetical protein
LADTRIPATHWAGRIGLLSAVAMLVLIFGFSGAFLSVVHWGANCGGDTIEYLWSPLMGDHGAATPPDPADACFHARSTPAAG